MNRQIAIIAVAGVTGLLLFAQFYGINIIPKPRPPNLALSSPIFYRPVMARMYAFNQWDLPGETPTSVGNAIARMNASFVSGLIRLEGSTSLATLPILTPQMVSDFNIVRNAVISASYNPFPPTCVAPYTNCGSLWLPKFDIWFRPAQMNFNATLIDSQIQSVLSSGIYVDVISLDPIPSQSTVMIVCNYVHQNGKLCNLTDIAGYPFGPPNLFNAQTYASTLPFNPGLNSTSINQQNNNGLPVLVGITNGPNPIDSSGVAFHKDFGLTFTYAQRFNIITALAQGQSQGGYAFAYPIFWPDDVIGPPSVYYDSAIDTSGGTNQSMLSVMVQLAMQYNLQP